MKGKICLVTGANRGIGFETAKRLEGTGVTVNAMHPGIVKTDILANVPPLLAFMFRLMARSPEHGARTAVWLATSADVAKTSGKLFADEKEVAIGGQATEPGLGERLWKRSEELVSAHV